MLLIDTNLNQQLWKCLLVAGSMQLDVEVSPPAGLARTFGLKNKGITGDLLQKFNQFQKYRRNWPFLQELQEI